MRTRELLLFGVVVILAATLRLVYLVHDHANEILVAKFRRCFFRNFVAGFARPNDEQNSIAQIGKAARIVNRKRRWRIKNHPIERRRQSFKKYFHAFAEQQFAWVRNASAAG